MPRFVVWIWRVCAIHYAIGMAAYLHFLVTGSYRYLTWYFLLFGTTFFLLTTAAEFYLAFECRAGFERDEPMRMTWTFIALSSLSRFVAAALVSLDHWRDGNGSSALAVILPKGLAHAGEVIGGPLSMIFLAIALSRVLTIQYRFGVLRGLTRIDMLLIAVIITYTLREFASIVGYLGPSYPSPSITKAMLWTSDPLLSLLLVQAVLIRRSTIRVGMGLISRCWGMYVLAIVTTVAGDASIWAVGEGLISAPALIALTWYIWFFSAAAFASAPAYQLAAMTMPLHRASERRGS